jgi:uncharacterized membrane protein
MNWISLIILIGCLGLLVKHIFMTAPFVPTHRVDLERIAALIRKYNINSLVDLGCGPGGVVGFLHRTFPDKKISGMEIGPLFYFIARWRFWRKKNVSIQYGNFFWLDWSGYDAVFVFWLADSFARKQKEFKSKVRHGQYVLSYAFALPGMEEYLVEKDERDGRLAIYVYRITKSG